MAAFRSSVGIMKTVFVFLIAMDVGAMRGFSYIIHTVEGNCGNGSMVIQMSGNGSLSSGILTSTNKISYSATMRCKIQLVAPLHHRVLVSIREIDFRTNPDGSCEDYLKIDFRMCQKSLGQDKARHFVSKEKTPNVMNMEYYTFSRDDDEEEVGGHKGFTVIFTAFKLADSDSRCHSGRDNSSAETFRCSNGRCIWSGLTCDGHNNCGDLSDEDDDGDSKCGINGKGTMVYIILGVLILGVLLLMCVSTLMCSKNPTVRRFSMRLRTRTQSIIPKFPGRR